MTDFRKNKNKKNFINRISFARIPLWKRCAAVFSAVVIFSGVVFAVKKPQRAMAVIDRSQAVSMEEYMSSHQIPNMTVLIGTYLIDLKAYPDFYDKAVESQTESGQDKIYYKSELSGKWYDITSAGGTIEDVSTGVSVADSEIGEVYVVYSVAADGAVTRLKDGAAINPFNSPNPYSMQNLPEMADFFKMYADKEIGDNPQNASQVFMKACVQSFTKADLTSESTKKCDDQMAALWRAYRSFKAAGKDDMATELFEVMKQVDAKRKAEIYEKLIGDTDAEIVKSDKEGEEDNADGGADENASPKKKGLLVKLSEAMSGVGFKAFLENNYVIEETVSGDEADTTETVKSGPDPETTGFSADADLGQLLNDAITRSQEKYYECVAASSSDADSALNSERDNLIDDIAKAAENGISAELVSKLSEIKMLENISSGLVSDSKTELELIDNKLLPEIEGVFSEAITGGVSPEFNKVIADGGGAAAGQSVIEEQSSDLKTVLEEFKSLMDAKTEREAPSQAVVDLYSMLDAVEAIKENIKEDPFRMAAMAAIEDMEKWLREKASEIAAGDEALKSEMELLLEQKEEAELLKEKALDAGDAVAFMEAEAKLSEIDKAIAVETEKQKDIMNDPNASPSERAAAVNALNGTKEGAIKGIADSAKAQLLNGEEAFDELEALVDMGAVDELKDIVDTLKDAAQMFADSPVAQGETGTDSGAGTGTGTGADSGAGAGTEAGADSGAGTGTGTGADSGAGTGTGAGADSGVGTGTGTGADSGAGTGTEAGADSGAGTGTAGDSGAGTGAGAGDNAGDASGDNAGDNSGDNAGDGSEDNAQDAAGDDAADGDDAGAGDGAADGDNAGAGDGAADGDDAGAGDGAADGDDAGADDDGNAGGIPSALADAIAAAEDALDDAIEAQEDDKPGFGTDGIGLSEKELDDVVTDFFGEPYDALSDKDKVVAVVALSWLSEAGNDDAADIVRDRSEALYDAGNVYIFDNIRVKGVSGAQPRGGVEYAALETVAKIKNIRYVFSDNMKEVKLAGDEDLLRFTANADIITHGNGSQQRMKVKPVFYGTTLYIDENTAKTVFALVCEPLKNTDKSVLVDGAMRKSALELLAAFKNE